MAGYRLEAWPRVVAREAAEVAAIEDVDDMLEMIQAARDTGGLNLEAFEIETSTADRLCMLQRQVAPYAKSDALRPLAEAVQLEIDRRRARGERPDLGIYGRMRVAEELRKRPPLRLVTPAFLL